MSASQFYNTQLGRFMVPLLIYHPGKNLPPAKTHEVTHHADIFPTIIDYLGLPENELLLFGRSVFDLRQKGESLLHMEGNYWLIRNDYFLQYNRELNQGQLFHYQDQAQQNPIDNHQVKSRLLNSVRAYIQYFQNGLIENDLYQWQK